MPVLSAETWTLERALETALKNNAELRASELSLRQAERAARNSWNEFLPDISAQTGISQSHTLAPNASNTDTWNASAGASLTFTAAIPGQMRRQQIAHEKAAAAHQNALLQLTTGVSKTFYQLIADRANIDILRANQELTRRQYDQVRRNYNNGLASELDMLNAQYEYQRAGPTLSDALVKYRADVAAFLLILGLDPGDAAQGNTAEDFVGEGSIEARKITLPAEADIIVRYLDTRFDVRSQSLAIRNAQADAGVALAPAAPSVRIAETFRLSPPAGAEHVAFDPLGYGGTFSITLNIPISPWIPGSSTNLAYRTAREALSQAQDILGETRKAAVQDIKKCMDEIQRIGENMDVAALNHRITGRAYTLSEQGYRNGLVSQTDLLAANQRMVTAEQNALNAKISYLKALYDLAQALQIDISELYSISGDNT
jgi:multidrug efflux system outer membrane protein